MYIFIINPIAGNGKAKRVFHAICQSNIYKQIKSEYYFTEHPGHAEEIVYSLLKNKDNIKTIIVIGGDGTIHEVINGLRDHRIPVSLIPGGSGNDFARGCAIKGKPIDLLERIISGDHQISYWIGDYTIEKEKRSFVNSIGFGFDAKIAKAANDSRYKTILNTLRLGTLSYLFALINVLFTFKPMDIELEVNGKQRFLKNCWMITISNHPFYGGGMKIIPNSKIEPNVFPVLILHSISKWKVLTFFMTVFTGHHIRYKEVELFYTTNIKFTSNHEIYFHADGETSICQRCTISKQQQSIQVLGSLHNQNKLKQIDNL